MTLQKMIEKMNEFSRLESFSWAMYLNGINKEESKKASNIYRRKLVNLYHAFNKKGGSLMVDQLISMYENDTPYSFETYSLNYNVYKN